MRHLCKSELNTLCVVARTRILVIPVLESSQGPGGVNMLRQGMRAHGSRTDSYRFWGSIPTVKADEVSITENMLKFLPPRANNTTLRIEPDAEIGITTKRNRIRNRLRSE